MAGGNWGQPQPWVQGTSLGMRTGQNGTSACEWRWFGRTHGQGHGCGVVRSCSSGRAKARASAGSSSPHQYLASQCLGASPQGQYGKGATLGCTGSELAPSPSSPSFVTPCGCSHNPYSRAHHQAFPNNYFTKAALLLFYGWRTTDKRWQPYSPISLAEHNFPGTVGSVAMPVLVNEPWMQHFVGSIALEKTWVNVFLITFLSCVFYPYSRALPFLWKRKVKLDSNPEV